MQDSANNDNDNDSVRDNDNDRDRDSDNDSDNDNDNDNGDDGPEPLPGSQMPGHPLTAVYCRCHDQGVLILGHHDNWGSMPPDWLDTICCFTKPPCNWWWHGHIETDGTNNLPSQHFYLSRYGTGWEVSYYNRVPVYDIEGNLLTFNDIRYIVEEVCIAMQDLDLPALVTLEIIDQLVPNKIKMWSKWEVITAVKHFHQRQQHTK